MTNYCNLSALHIRQFKVETTCSGKLDIAYDLGGGYECRRNYINTQEGLWRDIETKTALVSITLGLREHGDVLGGSINLGIGCFRMLGM